MKNKQKQLKTERNRGFGQRSERQIGFMCDDIYLAKLLNSGRDLSLRAKKKQSSLRGLLR